ncbi:hypothetical protein TNCV_3429361 [Trichonephila clavipes]|nr:hypothetical protein TNCV_3429361 [Trichonephila clavipes]
MNQLQQLFQLYISHPHISVVSRICLQHVDILPWMEFSDLFPNENVRDDRGREGTIPPVPVYPSGDQRPGEWKGLDKLNLTRFSI